MAFDQGTRNKLQRFVSEARDALTLEFTRQMQQQYGMDPKDGSVTPAENLRHLDDAGRETARLLRDTLEHYIAANPSADRVEALSRIVREQAFTVLNRLAALRMAEARQILTESISRGYDSKGFQLYLMLAGTGHGETGDAYRSYLFSIFDEFALDLNVLFDRFSPQGRLFPREAALLQLLGLMNDPEVAPLWGEDETIGWIYQYFNDPIERKKMRDPKQGGSAAPRNSRELAVRNQFFTPRYVVEFLTDNTLGRIWYEMTRGETRLKDQCRYMIRRPNEVFLEPGASPPEAGGAAEENLSQEELLRRPVHIPHRPLKDPRTIRVLDPACGSMHFGLYAYDLLEIIYTEAWELETTRSADAFSREPDLKPLRETYADAAALRRNVPRLIIQHNLHGIDIDPRAVQIAGLSLWLRAQRAWAEQGVKPTERPEVKRSNIVCAEPMPGEEGLLKEFVDKNLSATPELRLLGQLVRYVFEAMKLAGEAGSLLKIETEIANAVVEAKRKWLEAPTPKQDSLFAEMAKPEQQRLGFEVAGITDEAFWERAEKLIYDALRAYAEQSENGGGYQRRLFADDAARGFAFIDLCRKQYDVVLMNPPFGLVTSNVFQLLQQVYPDTYVDVYSAFVTRGVNFAKHGLVGAITSRSFISSKKLQRWRENQLINCIHLLADLGKGVMDDANIESCCYTIRPEGGISPDILAFDYRGDTRKAALTTLSVNLTNDSRIFLSPRDFLRRLTGAKLLYFLSGKVTEILLHAQHFEPLIGTVRKGLTTFDDFRFLRLRWEVAERQISRGNTWELFAKGGEYSNYYTDIHLVVKRRRGGAELAAKNEQINGQTAQSRQGESYYYKAGCQYTGRSQAGFSARIVPADCVMSSNAPLIISESSVSPFYVLGWVNSRLIRSFIEMQAMDNDFVPGILKDLPWLPPSADHLLEVEKRVATLIHIYRNLCSGDEIELHFAKPNLYQTSEAIGGVYRLLQERYLDSASDAKEHQTYLTNLIDYIYDIDSEEFGQEILGRCITDEITVTPISQDSLAKDILSYCLGAILGRWDIRFAMGEKTAAELPDPLAPLPVCPPGMLQNEERLPAGPEDLPESYPLRISWPGILVDDPGHAEDIEERAREVLHVIWPERADAVEQEACEILGVRSLREYFRKPSLFFADHLKRYSKSRRQAPIYWPLATPSGSYTLWLYYHRLDAQTLYSCVVEFVEPKLRQTKDALAQLRAKPNRARDEERELERLQDFALELQAFSDELLRIAELPWRPDLNDGVQITAAPLWKLFRLPKWQKTLKETWQRLELGDYDWAHLTYTVWPERVRDKCKSDKSLAIAHGLEDLHQAPITAPKKKRGRKAAIAEVEDL